MHTRHVSPTDIRLVALPVLDSRRRSSWKPAKNFYSPFDLPDQRNLDSRIDANLAA